MLNGIKINKVFIMSLLITANLFSDFSTVCAKSKKKPVEKIYTWDDTMWKTRRRYGMIARNVSEVKVDKDTDSYQNVYIRKRGEKAVKEPDLYARKPGKNQNYRMYTIVNNMKEFYPLGFDMLFLDSKNRLRLNSKYGNCYLFANHRSAKECKKEKTHVMNKIVERNLNPKKCWSDAGLFAYVKKNNLYITGISAIPYVPGNGDKNIGLECYQYEKPRMFFQGKGDQIKDVVCKRETMLYYDSPSIFVLFKDGSVWGMGSNQSKLISNSKMKYYDHFVRIVAKGVKQIAAGRRNVAVVKKNNALYVWGHTMKSSSSKKYKNSVIPQKITGNVKELPV